MSTSTPSVQQRNQYGRDWGNYASLTDCPNGTTWGGADTDSLEEGDTAYVTGTGRVYCADPGTPGNTDAVWALSVQSGGMTFPLPGEQTGTSELSLGMIYLTAGTVIGAASHALLGASSGVSDTASLRIRRFTGGTQVAIFSATGTPADTTITASYVVAATDWYEFTLAAGGAAQVAVCSGVTITPT